MNTVCILGLGYVGLPVALGISQKFVTIGFDISRKRISELKRKHDSNNEFKLLDFKNKKITFTNNKLYLKKGNFFIICVPTPVNKNNLPDLTYIKNSMSIISKILKSGDIIVLESTVYPGVTEKFTSYLEKKTKLINNKDFFMCYSPERVNPGDNSKKLKNIKKIFAVKTNKKNIIQRIKNVYNLISKKIIFSNGIKEAETAKAIENTQRDLNIALFNEILILSKKMNLNFNEIIRLASSKWNFIKFKPGLVGGHCLPVDPYYLSYVASKSNFKTKTLLAGRDTNNYMMEFVQHQIIQQVKIRNLNSKSKILLVGMSYKYGVSDLRNSLNIKIYEKIKKKFINTSVYDPFVRIEKNLKYKDLKRSFDLIVFLSSGKKFKDLYNKYKNTKNTFILDPFDYYS